MKKRLLLLLTPILIFNSCTQDDIILEPELKIDQDKITICHKGKNSISISINALQAHLDHGDTVGACGSEGYTFIPDDNFEQALIDLGYDNELDDFVLTSNIDGITLLDISLRGITDLTGIEDFYSLTFLQCYDNELTSIDVSNNSFLTHLYCYRNELISLDVSQNLLLKIVLCQGNNLITLNVKNDNNLIISKLDSRFNNLTSIQVDNPSNANNGIPPYNAWLKDDLTFYD